MRYILRIKITTNKSQAAFSRFIIKDIGIVILKLLYVYGLG